MNRIDAHISDVRAFFDKKLVNKMPKPFILMGHSAGSHVILQGPPGAEPDRETLKRAAAIAAYHSKAKTGGVVAVSGTRARHVTKPKGAKPGSVQISKETLFKVRPALPDTDHSNGSNG